MFRRRPLLVASAVLLLLAAAAVGTVGFLLKCEPEFYAAAGCPADYDTRVKASHVLTRVQELKHDIRTKAEWGEAFAADELNCFFAEMMAGQGGFASLLPAGFHSPRVAVDGDRVRLGMRYGTGLWSTVVWVEFRAWRVADETNLVAVEVCDLRAGRLAVGAQTVLDAVAEAARASNVEVTWYRHGGNPVGLFRFFPDQPRPASHVLTLEVRDGGVTVAGRTLTAAP
ncbi:MAG: hypothetical protein C0501_08325 [Isosphaera sp.]|nr:hypothetical protein [Isosphaera sp.]